ncbi:hypothetical protein J27TS7_41690 [Paenibacillus dendritiformis]|nr:hypothetical protein J27TS7_41690 [Paenibacillus dendritiformis]
MQARLRQSAWANCCPYTLSQDRTQKWMPSFLRQKRNNNRFRTSLTGKRERRCGFRRIFLPACRPIASGADPRV